MALKYSNVLTDILKKAEAVYSAAETDITSYIFCAACLRIWTIRTATS